MRLVKGENKLFKLYLISSFIHFDIEKLIFLNTFERPLRTEWP